MNIDAISALAALEKQAIEIPPISITINIIGTSPVPKNKRLEGAAPEDGVPLCLECGSRTHLVTTGKYGPFWGCNEYPDCHGKGHAPAPIVTEQDPQLPLN